MKSVKAARSVSSAKRLQPARMEKMIITPITIPVINDLNSYYLNMEKLIDHYQAELRSGGIHLKSAGAEGIIFFNEDTITNVFFSEKNNLLDGIPARDELIRRLNAVNFLVSVYPIEPDMFHYWANLSYAEDFYSHLATDATALDALIKQMFAEKLTGYIHVAITDGSEKGTIFFKNGGIIGVAGSRESDGHSDTKRHLQHLILQSKKAGASYSVKRIDLGRFQDRPDAPASGRHAAGNMVALLQVLMSTLESLIAGEKRIKTDFDTLLKKKFFEKADKYEFLDPFAAEVEYADGKFEFSGDTPLPLIAEGILESMMELAEDVGLQALLVQKIAPMKLQYQEELKRFGLEI